MHFLLCGCKVNQYETNAMTQKFIEAGYEEVSTSKKADVYVINTCTVTNMSDKKSRQIIRKAKDMNSNAIIVVTGCYAQIAKEELLEKIPEIDIVLGNNEKNEIVKYVEEFKQKKLKEVTVTDVLHQAEFLDFGEIVYTEKTRAVIKVQDGCDRFCSYCIIPYARGRVRSREAKGIIEEIKSIAKNGIKEVVITGIRVTAYGNDFKNGYDLIDLLEEIEKINKIERIRLGSLEPIFFTKENVERLRKNKKICNHFHLSLQSANNNTLKRMNRRYTIEEFEEITKLLRANFENAILTTDVIVGFPGETDEEFDITYENLKRINFYKMHVFKFSARSGTKAASMENQVSNDKKEERSKKLLELSDSCQKAYLNQYIGKELEVLFETNENNFSRGHTKNYIVVGVKDNVNSNEIKKVKINRIEGLELLGDVL